MYRDSPSWVTSGPRNMFGIAWSFKPNTGDSDSELWRTITIVQLCTPSRTHIYTEGVKGALWIHSIG